MVEYTSSRLCFKADIIEPLRENDSFAVHTPDGTFHFTKSEFYRTFPKVIQSKSYQKARLYCYPYPPKRARQFLISTQHKENNHTSKNIPAKDLVGNEIRQKIKEIGILWRNSPNNPPINSELLKKWNNLIEKWIDDESMPLIVRKEISKRGQSFKHPCGREIIFSDNTVAIWVFSNILKGKVFSLSEIKELLKHNELPIVFIATKEIKEKAKYTKPLGLFHSLRNWKVCHIKPVGFNTYTSIENIDISDIKEHFWRYVNPNNMFILPKEIGDLGEIDMFIEEQKRNINL